MKVKILIKFYIGQSRNKPIHAEAIYSFRVSTGLGWKEMKTGPLLFMGSSGLPQTATASSESTPLLSVWRTAERSLYIILMGRWLDSLSTITSGTVLRGFTGGQTIQGPFRRA